MPNSRLLVDFGRHAIALTIAASSFFVAFLGSGAIAQACCGGITTSPGMLPTVVVFGCIIAGGSILGSAVAPRPNLLPALALSIAMAFLFIIGIAFSAVEKGVGNVRENAAIALIGTACTWAGYGAVVLTRRVWRR